MKPCLILFVPFLMNLCICRDFYVGMFKKNDFIAAQDNLYKEGIPHRIGHAKYGRLFKCPITYIRVVDRLGIGRSPRVQITRGGLGKKYVVLRLTSPYNNPISVNIYIGCENKIKTTELTRNIITTTEAVTVTNTIVEATPYATSESTTTTAVTDPPIVKLMLILPRKLTTKKLIETTLKSEKLTTISEETTTVMEDPTTITKESTITTTTEPTTETTEPTTTTTEPTTTTTKSTTITTESTTKTTEDTTVAVKTRKRVLPRDDQENNNL